VPRRLLPLLSVVFGLEASLYACIAPLLPHYKHDFHLTKLGAGLLTGAYPAGIIAGAMIVWRLRTLDPRRVTATGLVVLGGASLLFGFGSDINLLDGARVLQGIGCGGVWGGGLGWLTRATTTDQRGRAFGFVFGAATFGTVLGPVFGTVATIVSARTVFGAIGLLAGILAVVVAKQRTPAEASAKPVSPIRELSPGSVAMGLTVILVSIAALGTLTVLVPLRLSALGSSNIEVGATFLAGSALATIISPFAGRLSDRKGRFWPIQIGMLSGAACLIGLSWASNPIVVMLLAIGYLGWAFNLIAPPVIAFISDVTEFTNWETAIPAIILVAFAGGELSGSIGGSTLATLSSDAVAYRVLAIAGLTMLVSLRFSKSVDTGNLRTVS
jgi:predicted MFS family arabinose efflux permease